MEANLLPFKFTSTHTLSTGAHHPHPPVLCQLPTVLISHDWQCQPPWVPDSTLWAGIGTANSAKAHWPTSGGRKSHLKAPENFLREIGSWWI